MDWAKQIDTLSKIFAILAIIVGGIWSYLKFIKGQILAVRLEPDVKGQFVSDGERHYLLVTARLRNVASSPVNLPKVVIQTDHSGLSVFSNEARDYLPESYSVNWNMLVTFPVFEHHQWIEAGEEIKEERMIPLPTTGLFVAFKVDLTIVSKKSVWSTTSIIGCTSSSSAAYQVFGRSGGSDEKQR